jgi:hypothetical protein
LPVIDLDEPEIGIEAQLAGHALLRVERRHSLEDGREQALAAVVEEELRRRAVEACCAVEMIDLDEDRPSLGGPALAQGGIEALHRAAPEIGGDPEVRAKA